MALTVHLAGEQDEAFLEYLKPLLKDEIELSYGDNLSDIASCELLVSGLPDREFIKTAKDLKTLIIPWAGLPRKTRELMFGYPHVSVHNIHHNAIPVAEIAVAMMLALSKNLLPIDASLRNHDWSLRYETGIIDLVLDKKALILGFGAAGKEIAARCRALGMEVFAMGRGETESVRDDIRILPRSTLNDKLPEIDVLFLSMPLTDETKGMFDSARLARLRDGAILINISRGRIIDEKALYEILKSGRIRAGLDVWYNYPEGQMPRSHTPPSEFPFHDLTNVIMTPHLAGHSDRTEELRAIEIARLLNLATEGKPLPNQVDIQRGY